MNCILIYQHIVRQVYANEIFVFTGVYLTCIHNSGRNSDNKVILSKTFLLFFVTNLLLHLLKPASILASSLSALVSDFLFRCFSCAFFLLIFNCLYSFSYLIIYFHVAVLYSFPKPAFDRADSTLRCTSSARIVLHSSQCTIKRL